MTCCKKGIFLILLLFFLSIGFVIAHPGHGDSYAPEEVTSSGSQENPSYSPGGSSSYESGSNKYHTYDSGRVSSSSEGTTSRSSSSEEATSRSSSSDSNSAIEEVNNSTNDTSDNTIEEVTTVEEEFFSTENIIILIITFIVGFSAIVIIFKFLIK